MAGTGPLVGRTAELVRIAGRLRDHEPPWLVLAGPAGVGKSRLAAEGRALATTMGYATAHVVATKAAASIPFGPFAALLPDTDIPATGLLGLLRSVGDAILSRAEQGQPLLLVVDDAHLLDDASAALVHQLAQRPASGVLATVRTPGPAPDPITALWKDGLAERVDLGPLTESEVADFAVGVLDGAVAGASVRRLWELSGGNALHLRELIRGAADSAALTNHDGMWILRQEPTAPERLVELVSSRLDGLPPGPVEVVDVLAVAGSLGFPLLESLTSPAAAEEAERLGLIQVSEDSRRAEARLAHPLYGEVRRQRMPKSQLRRVRGELADALAATGARRREDLLRLASWQVGAGRPADPVLLTRAATRARAMFDMELAGRLANAAVASGGGVEAGLVLAVTHFATGAHDDADRLLADLAAKCENDDERAAIANARAYNLSVLIGDPAASLTVIEAAMAAISDPIARLGLSARAASTMLFSGDPTGAIEIVEPALHSADDMVASRSYYVTSTAMALVGRTADAIAVAEQGLVVHRRCVEPNQIPEVQLIGATLGHLGAGATMTAADISAAAYQACLEAGDKEGMASFSLLTGCVLIEQGKLSDAALSMREGTAINRELSDTGALRWCLGGLAVAEGMARNQAAAAAAIADLDQLRADWMRVFSTDVIERGRAWALVAAGEDTAALRTLRGAAAQAAEMCQRIAEARLLHDVARLGEPGSVRGRLAELAEVVDGELVAVLAEDAAARSRHAGVALEAVAARFAGFGMFLLAAESAAAASAAYHEDGRSRPANGCARMAEEYAAIAGAALPAGTESAELDQLTRREREVASLAASGTSSKEIAAKLFISMRTVDNHLQRVYSKLGVNGRNQLRLALATGEAASPPIG